MAQELLTIGIDLGGTSVRVGLYDAAMRLIDIRAMPTRVAAGPESVVEELAEEVRALLPAGRRLAGIGIGSPGPINLHTGVLGVLPNLPGWENFPLRDTLQRQTGIPVHLESDANAAAIAEWKLGAGREAAVDSMAMITLGTGVGSGLILGGQIWHGIFGMSGEVGHTTVDPNGLLCGCGTRGCLEMYASAKGLQRLASEAGAAPQSSEALRELTGRPQGFTAREVAVLAEEHDDPAAKHVFVQLGRYLGQGLAGLINTLDPPVIVIGGGVASAWNLFAPAMFEAVHEFSVVYRLMAPTQCKTLEPGRTFLRPALLGPSAGLLGAALLPRLAHADMP